MPPGRRLVTSDFNIFLNLSIHLSCIVFSTGLLLRTVLGHMNFWPVFLLVEIAKITFQLNVAVLNVSCLLQFSVIKNFDWIHSNGDKVKMYHSYSKSFNSILENCYDICDSVINPSRRCRGC